MLATGSRGARHNAGGRNAINSAGSRYEVLERAGTGTLFVVYRVRDRKTNELLALKALKGAFTRHAAFAHALAGLARRTAYLSHPQLVTTREVGEEEGTVFLVTDWMAGGSLENRLQRGPLGNAYALACMRQTVEGLIYLHQNDLLHGDLRPRQLLFSDRSELRLSDAGQADAFEAAGMAPYDVQPDIAFYLAPERFDGSAPTIAADLYAAGAVLYYMLAGRVPFDGPSPLLIARRHRNEPPLRPSQFNPACSNHLEAIALRLLQKKPGARFGSATELLEALSTPEGQPSANGRTVSVPAPPVEAAEARATEAAADAERRRLRAEDIERRRAQPPEAAARRALETAAVETEQVAPLDIPVLRRRQRKQEMRGALLAAFWFLIAVGLLAGIVYGAYYFWVKDIPAEVTVPKYAGLNQWQAESVLGKSHLKMRIRSEAYDTRRPAGVVLSGDTPPGKHVRQGHEIEVTISRGEEPVKMVDFTELTLQRARQIILQHGMRLGQVSEQYHESVPQGYICGQYPQPGDSFHRSEPINLIVSRGPQPAAPSDPLSDPLPPAPPPRVDNPDDSHDSSSSGSPDVTLVQRAVQVRVAIPSEGQSQEVKIVVRDADGEHVVYQETHSPGDLVDENIRVTRRQGTTARVRVYVGGVLTREVRP